jgi:two-component system, cell cycle response regulator
MSSKTIMVVEDNVLNMKLVRSILKLNHYNILEAQDAETALQMVREKMPDLILMDIQLPGMSGLDATRIIVGDDKIKHIPIIGLTSYAMDGDKQKALDAGCRGYITKPLSHQDFIAQIKKYLAQECPEEPEREDRQNIPRILIVDDNELNVKMLKAKLPKKQFEIHTAFGGKECLEIVPKILPDLILLDIMMPEINGYEVTWKLKNDPKTNHIPIILVTALDSQEDKAKGLEAGADEFLTKPVNQTELIARVNSMIRLKKYHEQLMLRTQSEEQFVDTDRHRKSADTPLIPSRVLLVEDNRSDLRLIMGHLRDQPYEIFVAETGEKALSMALKEKIDVIILDVVLPGKDGYEVCRRIKSHESTRDIQVVMLTCLTDLESKIMGVEQGADDFLIKPVNGKEIRSRIKALLRKKAYLDQIRHHYEKALNSAITDGLTGLYNQAYFSKFLDLETKRALRQKYHTALMMLDLDDFKIYNDKLGHLVGDMLIREVAQVIRSNAREIDLVARYGGEEFAVILPYTTREEATGVGTRILEVIHSHHFTNQDVHNVKPVSASAGIAIFPTDADSPQMLIKNADEMLYEAKRCGKNCIRVFTPEDGK